MYSADFSFGAPNTDPFPPTRWSIVAQAGQDSQKERGFAWNELFKSYWTPLYGYVRHQGYSESDAEDLTQGFFAFMVQRRQLAGIAEQRGKLRAYLLTALKHFLVDAHRRETALKRGGGEAQFSIDVNEAEARIQSSASTQAGPDVEFDRQWALQLIEETLASVESEYEEKGKHELFTAFRPYVSFSSDRPAHTDLANQLGMKAGAVRIAVYRLRQRFATVMKEKIAETVASAEDVDEELSHLMNVFSAA